MTGQDRHRGLRPYLVGAVYTAAYVATVFAANLAIERHGLVPVGFGLEAPAGVYFVGLAFTLRDLTQMTVGRGMVLLAIVCGALLSLAVAPRFAFASGTAFLLSELCDFAVYTPLERRGSVLAVFASNVVGLVVDSMVFLWLAFGSLRFLPGQVVGKGWMTVAVVLVYLPVRHRYAARLASLGGWLPTPYVGGRRGRES